MEKLLTIENEVLRVVVSTKGAELKSIYSKSDESEFLWQGDAKWWNKSAPILFPRINLEENKLTSLATIAKHGFCRDHHFEEVSISKTKIILSQNENMIADFEFPFVFVVEIELLGKKININYKINAAFEFMIGSHPAFNIDLNNCKLNFPNSLYYKIKDQKIDHTHTFNKPGENLLLNNATFAEDALIFENNFKKSSVTLDEKIKVEHDSEYVGIWAIPGAPFVCIEPWYICPKELREFNYSITIL